MQHAIAALASAFSLVVALVLVGSLAGCPLQIWSQKTDNEWHWAIGFKPAWNPGKEVKQ